MCFEIIFRLQFKTADCIAELDWTVDLQTETFAFLPGLSSGSCIALTHHNHPEWQWFLGADQDNSNKIKALPWVTSDCFLSVILEITNISLGLHFSSCPWVPSSVFFFFVLCNLKITCAFFASLFILWICKHQVLWSFACLTHLFHDCGYHPQMECRRLSVFHPRKHTADVLVCLDLGKESWLFGSCVWITCQGILHQGLLASSSPSMSWSIAMAFFPWYPWLRRPLVWQVFKKLLSRLAVCFPVHMTVVQCSLEPNYLSRSLTAFCADTETTGWKC